MNLLQRIFLAALIAGASRLVDGAESGPVSLYYFAPGQHSLSLEIHDTGTRKPPKGTSEADPSVDRAFTHGKTLAITVHNLGKEMPENVRAEVFWFATKNSTHKLFLFYREGLPVEIPRGGLATQMTCEMPTVHSPRLKLDQLGDGWANGSKFAGWLVLLRQGDNVLLSRSSSTSIETATRKQSALHDLVMALEPKEE